MRNRCICRDGVYLLDLAAELVGDGLELLDGLLLAAPVLVAEVVDEGDVDVLHQVVEVRDRVEGDFSPDDLVVVRLLELDRPALRVRALVADEPDGLVLQLLLVSVGQEEHGVLATSILDVVLLTLEIDLIITKMINNYFNYYLKNFGEFSL